MTCFAFLSSLKRIDSLIHFVKERNLNQNDEFRIAQTIFINLNCKFVNRRNYPLKSIHVLEIEFAKFSEDSQKIELLIYASSFCNVLPRCPSPKRPMTRMNL